MNNQQRNLFNVVSHPGRKLWSYLIGGPLTFLTFYAVPILVILSTQTEHLPAWAVNLLPPFAWLSALFYTFCCCCMAVPVGILTLGAVATRGDALKEAELDAKERKSLVESCNCIFWMAGFLPLSKLAFWRQMLYGLGSVVALWASAYYFTGTIYLLGVIATFVVIAIGKTAIIAFIQSLPEHLVIEMQERPWRGWLMEQAKKGKKKEPAEVPKGVLILQNDPKKPLPEPK